MTTEFQQEILSRILTEVFMADILNISKEVDTVIHKNRELLGPDTDDGFYFGENWYALSGIRGRRDQGLHPDLYPAMILVEARKKTIADDRKVMDQVLCRLIHPFHTRQDIRDELLVSLVPTILGIYPRTRAPASSIQSDPRALRQYEKVLAKIHTYVAMRYIL